MRDKTTLSRGSLIGTLFVIMALTAGCHAPGDTSGFKAEQKPTKAQINQQIAQVKANPKIPANVKSMALSKLENDLKTAQ